MKRVLLTGATGFIGRQSIPFLRERGYEIHAVSSQPQPATESSVAVWHQADLLNPAYTADLLANIQPTHLLHFAWYAVPGKYTTAAENLAWVQSSLALVQAFVQQGGQRVVMAGTCFEYDWQYGYCTEHVTPCAPNTLYGTCKHALAQMLQAYATQNGSSAAWGRIFFLYGPHEYPQRLVASIIRALLNHEPARSSHGKQIRDFLHVADVASAFVSLLDSPVTGEVNIASGEPVTLRDIIFCIADILGQRDLVRLGALPARAGEPPLLVADTRRLREEVGWSPTYDLEHGIRQTIEWWQEYQRRNEGSV